jgi:hypothetical protein
MWKQIVLGAGGLAVAVGFMAACSDTTSPTPTSPTRATATYVSNMSAANELPPLTTGATGTATYTLNGRTISYTVTVNGLSDTAVAAHIHVGNSQTNGNIIVPFTPAHIKSGQLASGTINLDQPIVSGSTSITGDSLLALFNSGNAYTNVHTPPNPAGEIRGQIIKQ